MGYTVGILDLKKGWNHEENTTDWHSDSHARFGFGDGSRFEAGSGSGAGLHQGTIDGAGI
jgi:hypothetical protein